MFLGTYRLLDPLCYWTYQPFSGTREGGRALSPAELGKIPPNAILVPLCSSAANVGARRSLHHPCRPEYCTRVAGERCADGRDSNHQRPTHRCRVRSLYAPQKSIAADRPLIYVCDVIESEVLWQLEAVEAT